MRIALPPPQAAHLTGGVYLRPDRPAALLQYLLAVFLPAPGDRHFLSLPAGAPVDLRASCFCHRRPVSEITLLSCAD